MASVLVVVLVGGGLAAWATLDSDHGGNDDAPDATPPPAERDGRGCRRTPLTLATFYTQKLDWKKCDSNECTTLTVPLDYAHPDGRTIKLAVLRAPATRRGERVGQLVVDPGGPGGSAVDYAVVRARSPSAAR